MLQRSNFALLAALVSSDFAHRHLLHCDLSTKCVVHTDVDIAEGAMANHLAKLPFSYGFRLSVVSLKTLWVFFRIILSLLETKIAILVVVVEIVLVLLVVAVADLALVKGGRGLIHHVSHLFTHSLRKPCPSLGLNLRIILSQAVRLVIDQRHLLLRLVLQVYHGRLILLHIRWGR